MRGVEETVDGGKVVCFCLFFVFFFFKEKTAYEIRLNLVGSEMFIRDRLYCAGP